MSTPCEITLENCNQNCKEKCEVEVLFIEKKPCIVGEVLNDLRQDLIGELEAINQYSKHILKWKDRCPEATALLCEIMNDEKHHVAETIKLIIKLDPTQAQKFKEVGCPYRT